MSLADEIRASRDTAKAQETLKQRMQKNAIIDGIIKTIKADICHRAQLDPATNLYKCNGRIIFAQQGDLLYKLMVEETFESDKRIFSSKEIRKFRITDLGAGIYTEIKHVLEREKITVENFSIHIDRWPENSYYGSEIHVKSYPCEQAYLLPVRIEIQDGGRNNTRVHDGAGNIHMADFKVFGTDLCISYTYQE